METSEFRSVCEVVKADASRRLVFGFALVEKTADEDEYFDLHGHSVSAGEIIDSSLEFSLHSRVAKHQHRGDAQGVIPFVFPLTEDIAKSMGITAERYGLIIGMRCSEDLFKRFESGELTGFSIGGTAILEDAE